MWRVAFIGLVSMLAVCASGPKLPAPNTAQATFEGQQRSVQVMISDVAPAVAAELLGPDGGQYPALNVSVLSGSYVAYNPPPTVGFGIGGFGFSGCCSGFGSGVGVGLPVGGPTPSVVSDQYVSSALIPVPPDYAQHWSNYRVQIQVGNRTLVLVAPPPGAG